MTAVSGMDPISTTCRTVLRSVLGSVLAKEPYKIMVFYLFVKSSKISRQIEHKKSTFGTVSHTEPCRQVLNRTVSCVFGVELLG